MTTHNKWAYIDINARTRVIMREGFIEIHQKGIGGKEKTVIMSMKDFGSMVSMIITMPIKLGAAWQFR